ncbi:hypothetical protein F2Q70_00024586 [Brassica cretica]|uniref:Neprosin PEP catalytic domain-containing protein n=1 Tax=Brassica cretica TaxID=69181 RepID=A0A8S9LD62_BRACR|nr:hypothetical protein F2Q70_00024586 [Brassica cretica]
MLMKGRSVVGEAIGLLKARWKILQSLNVGVNHAPQTIVACCVLHNLCQIARKPEPAEFEKSVGSLLGFYAQPNNRKLFGWTLVGKDISGNSLRPPVDYLLLWSGKSTKVENNKDQTGYFWQPVPPDGYSAVGLIVTTTAEKPPLDKIRCVRSDLTDQSEPDALIWESNGFSVSSSKPVNRGTQASSVCVGTFTSNPTLACLKNNKFDFSCMPSKVQIDALFKTYAPLIYFHKDEKYLPSSISWFFSNGALLYKKGEESNPVPIEPNGSNLPQGEANDGLYWLDLPVASDARKRVQGGDLQSMEVYLHIKPVYGGTLTDIAVWMFYPFNGPSRAKLKLATIPLGRIGEHIGDWEHFTLRISNFSGKLQRMYLSQHSKGSWIYPPEIEFQSGGNKPVAYASLNGHAMYAKPGLVLQGRDDVGIRNDTGKSEKVFDTAVRFRVVSAEYLKEVEEPAWLNYMRHWGPKIDYGREDEIRGVEKIVVGESLKSMFRSAVNGLPNEVFGEEGPTGPKLKRNWLGCYNTNCPGFVQTSNRITVGGTFKSVSKYDGIQIAVLIMIWKDDDYWWLQINKELVGYWPAKLFSSLGKGATEVLWGGEIVNEKTGGKHTSTDMGSGHFADEGHRKASYFRNIMTVDKTNTLREPQGVYPTITNDNCYNIKEGRNGTSWGFNFFYGGPGLNAKCP